MARLLTLFDSCNVKSFRNKCIIVYIVLFFNFTSAQEIPLKIIESRFQGKLGQNATLSCLVEPSDVTITWMHANKILDTNSSNYHIVTENIIGKSDADGNKRITARVSLLVNKTTAWHHGHWKCIAKRNSNDDQVDATDSLRLHIPTRLVEKTPSPVKLKTSMNTTLTCTYEGFNLTKVMWGKQENSTSVPIKYSPEKIISKRLNETHTRGHLKLTDVSKKDNGTYVCRVHEYSKAPIENLVTLLILEAPQVTVDYIKAVGKSEIYLNWTIYDGHSSIDMYNLQIRRNGSEQWTYSSSPIDRSSTSYLITDLEPNQEYQMKISAKNEVDWGKPYLDNKWIKTLDKDPKFTPDVTIKGYTVSSMTVGWVQPPPELAEYIHYYELTARETQDSMNKTVKNAIHSGLPFYMFDNLAPSTLYTFKVRACSELTKVCGPWSIPGNATTMDGSSGPVTDPVIKCHHDNISGVSFVDLIWLPPKKTNGLIKHYSIEINGSAMFVNPDGKQELDNWGPMIKHSSENNTQARFNNVPHNTNFSVKVSAVTRTKSPGDQVTLKCNTPPAVPSRILLQSFSWGKVQEVDGRWLFRLHLPRITQRNGAICCYKVILVRLKHDQRLSEMPNPESVPVMSYKEVHSGTEAGAYIADVFTSKNLLSEVILGDGLSSGTKDIRSLRECEACNSMSLRPISLVKPKLVTLSPPLIPIAPPAMTTTTARPGQTVPPNLTEIPKFEGNSVTLDKDSAALILDKEGDDNELKMIKSKLQFPTHDEDLQQYQNSQSDLENLIHQSDAAYVYDRKYELGDDFYANKRIFHQNKIKEQNIDFDPDKFAKRLQKQDDTWSSDEYVQLRNRDIKLYDHEDDEEDAEEEKDYGDDRQFDSTHYGRHNSKYGSISHKRARRDTDDDLYKVTENSHKDLIRTERKKKLHEQKEQDHILNDKIMQTKVTAKGQEKTDEVKFGDGNIVMEMMIHDGLLDSESNYTGFIELLVDTGGTHWTPVYSNYFSVLNPGPDFVPGEPSMSTLNGLIMVTIGLGFAVLIFTIILCVLRSQNRRSAADHGVEMNNLHNTLRNICQGFRGGRHQLVSNTPPDLPPILKANLLQAYLEREMDSGYRFQHEFERLPDCFNDRTMDVSEAKENQGKNRYPDIKAYDQTRVKISFIEGVLGSDYINANYVMGYKERKKFICAQGPTDATVDDFWRMIWEQNLELVVMLTKLEECSKVKCAKYWPEQHNAPKVFAGSIHVQHMGEKRYSDFVVRELRVTKQPPAESNNIHVIESNGIKKNGDVTNGNGTVNTGTGTESAALEERIIKQYQYLTWKDFVAPEHPHAMLKFIKRVNEAAIGDKTILVHCSAGVGRTGTMVALDCLLEQLDAEGQVTLFNTVCNLRRQRNYLVQSLKQYIFIYRALLEYALYSDTEIPVAQLKSTVDRLRQNTGELEEEFEKLKQPYFDQTKPSMNGRAPEHLAKNKSETVIPYDNNRVILAPIATREHSTYINASFIEGYDNSESYIIAQDPLPTTISDFWRMVSEQEINTIVMLSELGEGKCPRYWDDEEIQYDHMSVRYLQSESCPYYTRREFQVTNTKNQERINVTQLQYHGWPTVNGQVPEVTRGLIELIGQSGASPPTSPPVLVHCSLGTERSSMFVALCILITQLRTEQRVDVSTVTRKLRSQRIGCLDTFLQYEFLYRAIVNYAELHGLLNGSS